MTPTSAAHAVRDRDSVEERLNPRVCLRTFPKPPQIA